MLIILHLVSTIAISAELCSFPFAFWKITNYYNALQFLLSYFIAHITSYFYYFFLGDKTPDEVDLSVRDVVDLLEEQNAVITGKI